MKIFQCQACDQPVGFESTVCESCERRLGYVCEAHEVSAIEPAGPSANPAFPGAPTFRAYAENAAERDRLLTELPQEKWTASRDRFLHLRFARLCYYLRVRKPDAVIGYSIFVYRLSAEEVRAATAGSLKDWSALIERSGDSG